MGDLREFLQTSSSQVLLTSIDLTIQNIMTYCGTWFGSNHKGF
jgi:hypothetical protein